MLTFEQIQELIDQVARHRLSGIELERSGFRLKIDGHRPVELAAGAPAVAPVAALPATPAVASPAPAGAPQLDITAVSAPAEGAPAAPAEAPSSGGGKPAPEEAHPGAHVLSSPIVGTFYRAPDPDSPPYVDVGDRVKKGQVLCIVEAMKLMNEIESDVNGTVLAVHVENAQPVEYGEPLFSIKAD